jgi:hypothetical protein
MKITIERLSPHDLGCPLEFNYRVIVDAPAKVSGSDTLPADVLLYNADEVSSFGALPPIFDSVVPIEHGRICRPAPWPAGSRLRLEADQGVMTVAAENADDEGYVGASD